MRKRHRDLVVGDKVAYSVQWLKSVGMSHTEAAHARGHITDILPTFGPPDNPGLATIKWNCDMPERVLVANLALVGLNSAFSNVD